MAILLSREAILAAPVPLIEVEVPEWGGAVRVRALSAKSRVKLLDAIYLNERANSEWKADQEKPEGERLGVARVDLYDQSLLGVLFGLVDETGECLFSLDDYDAFTELNYPTVVRLWTAMTELSNADVETLKKTSASIRKGAFSSASRSRSAKR